MVVSSLMIFSIGRTTVSGLNFDPYFFQLCSRTQVLKNIKSLVEDYFTLISLNK